MHRHRSFLILCLLLLPGTGLVSADMISWTDENGVRHFSNAAGPERGTPSRSIEEYKPESPEPEQRENDGRPRITKSQRDEIMRRYRENKKREEEKWRKIYEKEDREYEEKVKRRQKTLEKLAKSRKESCEKATRALEELRRKGWERYVDPKAQPISCPDRIWFDRRGIRFDNKKECLERRDRQRKAAYNQAVRSKEYARKMHCPQ